MNSSLINFCRIGIQALSNNYYLRYIHPDVPKSVGRWVLEKLRVYNPYSGVTNNEIDMDDMVWL